MGILEVPLHEVNIKSSLINGNIVIGMRPSLPVEGISLILGNDLAGERVMVDPRVVEKPRDDEKTERLAEKFPRYIPCLCGNTFNEGKERSYKGKVRRKLVSRVHFLKTLMVSLRRGIRKRRRKP